MKHSALTCTIDEMQNKRRKLNLTLKPIQSLKCEICKTNFEGYKECTGQYIYCSRSCLSVLLLRIMNEVQKISFEDDEMKVDLE